MKGQYVGRDDRGRAVYVPVDYEDWVPRKPIVPHFSWPPRTIRRVLPVASRPRGTRRQGKAEARLIRAAARYGIRVTAR